MCGIAGLLAPDLAPHERLALVQRMIERLTHRGPDGVALWDGDGIALGLSRLAIVAPHLPARLAVDEDGAIHAVVNGEIYNHHALRAWLAERGHDSAGGPDTSVVPHLYEEVGAAFPERMDGMFAAAVWDGPRRRLVLARDRAGEKPLFIAAVPGRFAFASEPAALLSLPWVSRDPAPASLARYLAHGFFAGSDCAFAALRQLPPAHVLVVEGGREHETRYWRPWDALVNAPFEPQRDDRAVVAATLAELGDAIESRVPAEVPFGVFLSGGVDSGLVAGLVAARRGRFPTFSLKMADRGYDESAYARMSAEHFGTEHHEIEMDWHQGEEALETFAAGMDQPLGDPSVLPTWALGRLARKHVPVVLTGEGGDELFAGYPTYLGHRHAGVADALPAALSGALVRLARRFSPRHHHVTLGHLAERFLGVRGMPPFERHLAWFGTAGPAEARALLAPALGQSLDDAEALGHVRALARAIDAAGSPRLGTSGSPRLAAYQLLDFETYLGGGLLTKVDRCTMAHGVESRAPFLRPRLIEFALALPESARLRGRTGKWALKQAARGILPDAILDRRKQGFSPPFSAWARGPLRASVEARLSPERIKRAGVLDPAHVRAILEEHVSGRGERGRTLWTLLSLQMWAERWVTGDGSAAVDHLHGATRATSPAPLAAETPATR
jgi:asparagine synthase (glutamine-hydrolysing)